MSEIGDILSPKNAPLTTAPITRPMFMFMPMPIATMARPTVEIVPQDVPVNREVTEQRIRTSGRNIFGLMMSRP